MTGLAARPSERVPARRWVETDARFAARSLLRELRGPRLDLPVTTQLSAAQWDCVRRAARILRRRGGVLLADRTGSGKTHVAIALIEHALAAGRRRILVTGPAGLRPQWAPLLRRLGAAHDCDVATGRTARSAPPVSAPSAGPAGRNRAGRRLTRPAITWLSHTMLSLGRWPAAVDACDLVVVDEAHAFRNRTTRRHRSLAWLCRDAQVLLLTATPVNNSLMDLYFLLRLFLGDGALEDLGVPDLRAAFRSAAAAGGPVRPPLDAAIDAVTVRGGGQARRGAPDTAGPRAGPRRVVTHMVRYDLDAADPGRARWLLDGIRRLELAPYSVTAGGPPPAAGELIRFGLVKRLESSPAAFAASARALSGYLDAFADAALEGFWLRPDTHRSFASAGPGQLLLAPLALPRLPPPYEPERLVASIRPDAAWLRAAIARLGDPQTADPKAACLIGLLAGPLAGRKVLAFTEYQATAVHLWQLLRERYRVGLIHGSRATLGMQPARRLDVVSHFSPAANGVRIDHSEEIDVLIATDVLAEGFNLQDAADVVSYDLPWNPVRLIQRVGRIDRLGSSHETVRCHNFMPDHTMDLFLGLVDRIAQKLDALRAGPGRASADRSVAVFDQPPSPGRPGRPAARPGRPRRCRNVRDDARAGQPSTRPVRVAARLLRRLDRREPDLFAEIERIADPTAGLGLDDTAGPAAADAIDPGIQAGSGRRPAGRVTVYWIVALAGTPSARLLTLRPGPRGPRVTTDPLGSMQTLDAIAAGRLAAVAFRSRRSRPRSTIVRSGPPGAHWRALAAAGAAIEYLVRGRDGRDCGVCSSARLVRRLLRVVAREPGGPDADLCARVDAVVDRLRAGIRSGLEAAIAGAIRRSSSTSDRRPGAAGRMVAEIETLLGAAAVRTGREAVNGGTGATGALPAARGRADGRPEPDVLAVFEIRTHARSSHM